MAPPLELAKSVPRYEARVCSSVPPRPRRLTTTFGWSVEYLGAACVLSMVSLAAPVGSALRRLVGMRKRSVRSCLLRSKKARVWFRLLCSFAARSTCDCANVECGYTSHARKKSAVMHRRSYLLHTGAWVEPDVLLSGVGDHKHFALVALSVGLEGKNPPDT